MCCDRILLTNEIIKLFLVELIVVNSQTCAYVASRRNPENWRRTDSDFFWIDRDREKGGLGISEWRCPHPPLGRGGNEEYCVFHADPAEVPANVDQREELLDALNDAGDGPWDDRPEHRGQFVGATFSVTDLSREAIAATNDYDIRFDHARFQAEDDDLSFEDTVFETHGQYPVSFCGAEFTVVGDGIIWFNGATFRTSGDGGVWFNDATFQTGGDSDVVFRKATFKTEGDGSVGFNEASFQTDNGNVRFRQATFETKGDGGVGFNRATFQANGDGDVGFYKVVVRTDGNGDISFRRATFRTDRDGKIRFQEAMLTDAHFRSVDFGEANFGGANLTGTDLREATIADISVAGATICKRLYEGEGWEARAEPGFDFRDWDATARAYHDLKTVFSDHGLVGKARAMYIRERRARSYEAKAAYGQWDRRYLGTLPSRIFTGYGVRVRYLVLWMVALFTISTAMYMRAGVEDTFVGNAHS
jgi:uncharacterized protein YjbI with pentapeptide repeats